MHTYTCIIYIFIYTVYVIKNFVWEDPLFTVKCPTVVLNSYSSCRNRQTVLLSGYIEQLQSVEVISLQATVSSSSSCVMDKLAVQ